MERPREKKKEEPVFVSVEVCFFSPSLTAAAGTPTIASHGAVIPVQPR